MSYLTRIMGSLFPRNRGSMKFCKGAQVFVRYVKGTTERIQTTSTQKKMFGSTGTIVTELENGFFNVKHESGYFRWHESSLAEDPLAKHFNIHP